MLAAETYIWGLQGICQLHRIPFAPALILQQFPPPYSLVSLHQAATALGLRSGLRDALVTELPDLPVPFVALLKPATSFATEENDGSPVVEHSQPYRLAIIVKCDSHSISYYEKSRQSPFTSTTREFGGLFAGKVMLCVPAALDLKGLDVAADGRREFGFRWFVPELFRHKAIWRDVLLASLAIQLMALATPVFTQIVIDKVIVHHTMSTLGVIGIALGVFIIFTAVMSWA
jgi:subfamily B ATP-binding cassette protein HlyB/CyaB